MPTILASSENLAGNISSCKTEISIVNCINRTNPFYCEDRGYATNNCSGQTEILTSWSFTGFFYFSVIIAVITVFAFIKWIND